MAHVIHAALLSIVSIPHRLYPFLFSVLCFSLLALCLFGL